MFYLLLLIILFPLHAATSKFDLSAGLQGRTLPALGAEVYVESGYNQLIWGERKKPKDFLYGLVRPSLGVSSSGVINSVRGELEVYPISILGISAGRQYINSNYDFPFFDCEKVVCQGEFVRDFVDTKLVLGFKNWVFLGNFKVETLRSPDKQTPMADWRNVIIGDPGEEVQIEKKFIIGNQFEPDKLVGILVENVHFEGSGERRESFAAVYQVRKNDTSYMIGAGALHTDQQPMGFTLYFRIHYVPLSSLRHF